MCAVVAQHLDPDVADGTDAPGRHQVAGQLYGRGVAVVEPDGGRDPRGRDRVGDLLSLGEIAPRRLLDPDVLARTGRRDGDVPVVKLGPATHTRSTSSRTTELVPVRVVQPMPEDGASVVEPAVAGGVCDTDQNAAWLRGRR